MKWLADREKNWRSLSGRLTSDPPDASLRVLVLAAHPDDETIGASLMLSRFPNSSVAFLTDGAPRDTKLWPPSLTGSRSKYADLRRREAESALGIAGISESAIFWLGGVDQESAFEIDKLASELERLLRALRPEIVITHPYEGGHPDHDTAALVAMIAASQCEHPPVVLEMTSYHVRDGRCVTGEFLNAETSRQSSFELNATDKQRKRRMMDAHASQRLVLENFPIDREPLRLAPEYDFSKPPHEGKLWYECLGWKMTGTRWRELATAAISKHQVQACR